MKHDHKPFGQAAAYASATDIEARINRFLPMVRRAAWHIYGSGRTGLEIEDLVQVGVLALTQCAQRHVGPEEDGFAAYAKLRVRGAMFDLIRKLMPESRGTMQRRKRYRQAVKELTAEHGRPPTRCEIASRLGCEEGELVAFEIAPTTLSSIEDAYDESNRAFADEAPDPFEALCAMEDRRMLLLAIAELPQRLQLVLQLFFVEELNLTEIAGILEVSVPRVHQLRGQALSRLKSLMLAQADG